MPLLLCLSCGTDKTCDDYKVWGIDVSWHQGRINWRKVLNTADRPSFVFVKATEGSAIVDTEYERHRRALDTTGVLFGAYHFFGHRTSGKEQASLFIKTARLRKGNLPPVLDIEPHRFMTDPKKSVKEAKAFCNEIKKEYGVYPIIYCSSSFYNSYLSNDFRPGRYVLWIADYSKHPPHDWQFWQHTDSHKLKHIGGKVDRNVFVGDEAQLQEMVL